MSDQFDATTQLTDRDDGDDDPRLVLGHSVALELNPRQRLAPVSDGIDFLGYIVRRDYLLVRRRVVHNLETRLRRYEARLVTDGPPPPGTAAMLVGRPQPATRGVADAGRADRPAAANTVLPAVRCHRFDAPTLDALAATLSSYLGHLKLANSWRLWQTLWQGFDFLGAYFEFDSGHWRLVRKYPVPAGLNTVRRQYRYLRWRFPEDALLFRVGRFYEFYDIGQPEWLAALGLQRMGRTKRWACYGFPAQHLQRNLGRLLSMGVGVTLVGERPSEVGGCWRGSQCAGFPCVPTEG